jgi:fumarylpyruvate hydrolase
MDYAVPAPPLTTLAVAGTAALWPVRRVLCVGRNYAEHAREMGADPDREPPFFFGKPTDAVISAAGIVPYPPLTNDLQFEVELVIAIGGTAANIASGDALRVVFGYAVGVDLTRRDLQNDAKALRRPWDWAKGFDASAPVSPIQPFTEGPASGAPTSELPASGTRALGVPTSGAIWLNVNGEEKQRGDLAAMIWGVAEIVAFASQSVVLKPGDLIFTGTPAGVGTIVPGDVVSGGVEGVAEFSFTIGDSGSVIG